MAKHGPKQRLRLRIWARMNGGGMCVCVCSCSGFMKFMARGTFLASWKSFSTPNLVKPNLNLPHWSPKNVELPSACVKMHNGAKSQRAKVILYTFLIFCSFARTQNTHTRGYKMVSAVVAIRKKKGSRQGRGGGWRKKKLLEGVGWQHFADMTFRGKKGGKAGTRMRINCRHHA